MLIKLNTALFTRFTEIVGTANALTSTEDKAPYLREWRDRYTGKTPVVLRPGTTEDVSRILALANEEGIGVVPQGGNTGLVGGQIPSPDGDQIVLSLGALEENSRRRCHGRHDDRRSGRDAARSAERRGGCATNYSR